MNQVSLYGGQRLEIICSGKTSEPDTWDVEVWISNTCHLVSACGGYPAKLFPSALLAIENARMAAKNIVDRMTSTRDELSRFPRSIDFNGCSENHCDNCEYSTPNHSLVCLSLGNPAFAGGFQSVEDGVLNPASVTPFMSAVGNSIKRAGSLVHFLPLLVFATIVAFVLKILFRRAFSRFDNDEFC